MEYLQLTIEPDETQGHPLLRPRILLPKPDGALEAEERRRVFWNVFLLDRYVLLCASLAIAELIYPYRFCSLTSG